MRIEFGALVVLEEVLARDAVALGEPHQSALVAGEALVDVVELLDQGIDARLIEPQRLHLGDDLFLELLVLALLRWREQLVAQLVVDVLILQAAQALERVGDGVEGLQHLGLELRLDRGERHRILEIVLVQIAFAERASSVCSSPPLFSGWLERRGAGGGRRRSHRLRRHDREERGRPRRARRAAHRRPARQPAPPWRRVRHRSLRDL